MSNMYKVLNKYLFLNDYFTALLESDITTEKDLILQYLFVLRCSVVSDSL